LTTTMSIFTKHIDRILRRVFDIAASLIGLILLFPFMLLVAIAIKATDKGPVFFCANRVGRGGQEFRLLKFRSMRHTPLPNGPAITAKGDVRVTSIGLWIRKFKLDELPQLINVLKGDMSLVGPRPEDPKYVALYSEAQRKVLLVRPGITSAASIAYRNEEQMLSGNNWEEVYRSQIMPHKLELDMRYLEHRNVLSDILLIFKTILALFK